MALITLTKGYVTQVDDEDFAWLSQYSWRASVTTPWLVYAMTDIQEEDGKIHTIGMHRLLVSAPEGSLVDHADRNTLNNKKENLRLATKRQNSANSRDRIRATSKYRGVCQTTYNKVVKWRARITLNGRSIHLGVFDNELSAAAAYDEAALQNFGEFSTLNFSKA